MSSYGWSGLAEGISPYAQELFKHKLKEKEEKRKPAYQLQSGVLDAVRSMTQAPTTADLQAQSDAVEANAAPGSRLDMNQVVKSLAGGASPEMVQTPQPMRIMEALKEMGVTSLGGDSIGMSRYGSGMNQLGYFDPDTREFKMVGEVPKGSIVKSAASTVDTVRKKAVARGEGYTEGSLSVKGLSTEQVNSITSNRAIVRSVDNLISLFDKDPGLFERASLPGARLGDEGMKEVNLWLNNIQNFKALAQGGRTLTANELERTRSTLTSLVRGEPVSRIALEEIRNLASENSSLLEGSYSKSKLGGQQQPGLSTEEDDLLNSLRQ